MHLLSSNTALIVLQWKQNPYFQYFCGEKNFQTRLPCHATELVHFRKRIGADGVEKIFQGEKAMILLLVTVMIGQPFTVENSAEIRKKIEEENRTINRIDIVKDKKRVQAHHWGTRVVVSGSSL